MSELVNVEGRSVRKQRMRQFFLGARDTLPLIVAAIPFGIVFGAMAQTAGFSAWATQGMSLFVFAGASQFIAAILWGTTALPIIVLTVFIVNLRHALYSASLMPQAEKIPHWQRLPMAFGMTDETFAIVASRARDKGENSHFMAYFFGSATLMYLNWQLCTWIGIVLGQSVPDITNWGLDVAMVVAFIGIVVPLLKRWSHFACALTAFVAAVVSYDWPHQTGLLFASLVAIVVGLVISMREERQGVRHEP